MNDICLQRGEYDKLTITPKLHGRKLELSLVGTCDSFAIRPLATYLDGVTAEIDRLSLEEVAIDVSQLSLLNSSSLKQFITFLRPIKLGERSCRVEFVVDDALPWQRRCLSALVRMCPSAVSIRDAAGNGPPRTPSLRLVYADPTGAGSNRGG